MSQRDPGMSAAGLLVVGKDVPRNDAVPKVTGAAQYPPRSLPAGHRARALRW